MKIKLIGVGGAGCNAISRLGSNFSLKGVSLASVNTDAQSLLSCKCPEKLLIGENTTKGFGAGMDWKLGEKAALESQEELKKVIKGNDLVFLIAGLGGGSGTPGVSVIGNLAREMGVLSIALVTLPFSFEGAVRRKIAQQGLEKLKKNVDAFLLVSNDRILKSVPKTASIEEAFLRIDNIVIQALKGIVELLSTTTGIVSIDFADLEEILRNSGQAFFGEGLAKGEHRASAAAAKALYSPFLEFSPKKARGILFNIEGKDVSLAEVNLVAGFVKKIATPKTKIIFGVSENKNLKEKALKVVLIATGIE